MAHTSLRIPCRSHAEAKELALRLEADGYRVARRWKAVLARTATIDEAERLAGKLEIRDLYPTTVIDPAPGLDPYLPHDLVQLVVEAER